MVPLANLHPAGPGLFGKRSVLGIREAAALWHPPGAGDETPLVERSGARALLPSAKGVRGGAPVGDTTAGKPRPIRFPEDLLRRHHLYVARTRMGKSTLMHHIAVHKMREKAAGRDGDAIVVVDPHADLVAGLLRQVPESLIDRVRLIDLADQQRAPGINLLDTRVFADRDRTADSVVRVARGLWEQWGPRMQSILEQTVKTLHEANEHPETDQGSQHTILDGLKLLSDRKFRDGVLKPRSRTPTCWSGGPGTSAAGTTSTGPTPWPRCRPASPTTPPPSGRGPSWASPAPPSTCGRPSWTAASCWCPPPKGAVGRDVSALVGASLLNLVDSVIREQESLPLAQRRGALVVVDEMQSLPGVDYESRCCRSWASTGLPSSWRPRAWPSWTTSRRPCGTPSWPTWAAWRCSRWRASDARQLVWELGKDRVSEDDIVSLPVHHCYVRATVGTERMPAFSMMVRKPEEGDADVADRIRQAASAYTLSDRDLSFANDGAQQKVSEYRRLLAERNQENNAGNGAGGATETE